MHKLKRVLALILAAAMILGYAPKSVRADGFADSALAEEVVTEETAEETAQTEEETERPAPAPTEAPTEAPTQAPTEASTQAPTEATTEAPTEAPAQEQPAAPAEESEEPTQAAADEPAVESGEDKLEETEKPAETPTEAETQAPTEAPTEAVTEATTEAPADEEPTKAPTEPALKAAAGSEEKDPFVNDNATDLEPTVRPLAVRAADNSVKADHGAVKIYNYNFDSLVNRLQTKYPGVFKTINVYGYSGSSHPVVGTTIANRALLSNATNHRQGNNAGRVTVKFINGNTRSTSNWAQGLGNYEAKEYFTVNGHIAYCFDWTTSATAGSHKLSASLSEASINATTTNVTELAQVAKMLTKDNYALIVQNASSIAKGLSIAAYTDPDRTWFSHGAVTISKSDVESLLRDTTADGLMFKRALVQMLVWSKMNAQPLCDWMYSFYADSGYEDKEGNYVDAGEPCLEGPIIGYGAIINFNTIYNTGKNAWNAQSSNNTADYVYEYELTVGVPFSVPASDVGNIKKIVQANGNKIESSGSVTVNVTSSGVTLTATQPIANWTSWMSTSESSSMIYSSKPYDPGTSGTDKGSGQFIVDVSEMKFMKARVKAVQPTGTVTITKSSANTTITDGNSCYSLAGAQYGLYTNSGCTTLAKDSSGNDAILTTTTSGSSNTLTINAGNYWIKEIKPSPGYGLASGTYAITVTNNGSISLSSANSNIFAEPPLNDPLSIVIQKTPATEYASADFDMSGAQYTVKYYAGQYTKDTLPAEATTTWAIETKKVSNNYVARLADGYVISGSAVYGTTSGGMYIIPLGTLTVEETQAPTGFKIEGSTMQLLDGDGSDATDGIALFNLVDQNSAVSVISGNQTDDTEEGIQILQKETVASVDVKVKKTSDDGNVSGISFTLSGTLLAGGTYNETRTTDANGEIDFGEVPYGSFTLTENLTDDQAKIYVANAPVSFTIDADTESPYTVNVHNTLKRGSVTFTKVLKSSGEALANIPWKLTNTDTDEVHYFISGADGTFNSERGTHSANTNGADQALSAYVPDTDIVPDSVISELVSAGAASYGVWFGPGEVNDDLKALPLGSYKLEEMKTEGRKSLVLVTLTFEVESDGQVVALGSIENEALKIGTEAKDSVTNTHNAFAGPNATIIDTVTYSGCKVGETYTVNGELMLIKEDGTAEALGVTATGSFTADASSGSTTITFTFDASDLAGKKIVAYETLLTVAGQFAAEHKDPTDENQIITFPKIGTVAKDSATGISVSEADGSVTIIDTVTYENLIPGTEYTLKGELMDKATGSSTGITAEKKFTPAAASGSEEVTFTFDGTALAGKVVVAYETLYIGSNIVAEHKNIQNDDQTVYLPKVETELVDNGTGTHHAEGEGTVTLTDTVTYTNLRPGRQYTVKGELMNKATGESNGITAEKTFTPNSASGTVELTFTFDGAELQGTIVVAFERLFYNGIEVAVHADINDEDQTVWIPGIDTTAVAEDTQDHVTGPNEQVTIIDRADYTGLEIGREYTVKGELYDKETGESIGITAEETFTAKASEGYVELTFTFDASLLAGKTVVAFETLYTDQKEVAIHHDIEDEDQSVHIPEIETDAADTKSGLNHIEASATASVTDIVTYKNLVPGKEYKVVGELYDKETGESIGVTAETTFTPEEAGGTVEVVFEFDASDLGGKTLVAFETLYFEDVEIAVHADIEDDRQTIYVPEITTDAKNDETGTHEGTVSGKITITDVVTYTDLVPGEEYSVKGVLMDKATNKPLLVNGKEVTSEKTFTPEETDGTVELSFTFDSTALNGKTVVVFETLYYEDVEVAVHADINDENQAVIFPGIGTKASNVSDTTLSLSNTKIRDDISYTGLTPGSNYVIVTTVYDKTAKEMMPGTRKETNFSPEKANGTVTVNITVDASDRWLHQLVVFEEIYLVTKNGRVLVAAHQDPNDRAQTLYVPGTLPKTGDESRLAIWGLVTVTSIIGVLFTAKKLAGNKKDDEVDS